jgi:hypothetical protein
MKWRGRLADLWAGLEVISMANPCNKQGCASNNPKESRIAHLQVLLGKNPVTKKSPASNNSKSSTTSGNN